MGLKESKPMKKIVIEEIISQTFEVSDDATLDEIREMYRQGKLVVESGEVTQVNVLMSNNEEWQEM